MSLGSPLSSRIGRLAQPPRPVPLRVACRAMLGLTGDIGAITLFAGLATIWIIGGFRPIAELRLALSPATARGVVTGVSGTNTTVNDEPVYAYQFTFRTPTEQTITGESYTVGRVWSVEDRVDVQYVPKKPTIARIAGSDLSTAPWWIFLITFTLTFGAGASLLGYAAATGWRQVTLLRHGEVAGATDITASETGMRINNVPVLAYAYTFRADDGQAYQGASRALPGERIGDETPEPILYLPRDPRNSLLVDTLPLRYQIEVDEEGQWKTNESAWPVVWCVLIWTGLAAGALYSATRLLADL